ncbi:MAG: DUF3883 domain-containing protein [Anaerolineales bacterium]|nr:DUF3883 domain-containing protein [Anaerolineales bacterium]
MPHPSLLPNTLLTGPYFDETVQVITTMPIGDAVKLIGKGLRTGRVHEVVLSAEQVGRLEVVGGEEGFDGDGGRFKLGVEAMRLKLAYEYDPFFSLSIARIDPLPHQLEAVYEYFLKSPRIRFLLADDPGAGKTIMAGLLIKELKIRGLARRILIVAPANLTFQWQRELKDKFREPFEVIRGDVLRANYGSNPWQERSQVITSVSWVSRIEDAKESLLRSQWDLVIVDEAHKMSASNSERKTLAYQLGEALGERTDHFLLMTATPHKGDPTHFNLFLQLLDRDVYGDVSSLEEAMRRQVAPFYLRRVKEALVSFPEPESGQVKMLFTKRNVRTAAFELNFEEMEFYDELTRYVEDQSSQAAADDSPRGRALGFTMAMLQRRFASSMYAVRRSLERMRDKRQQILDDPEGYRQEQIARKLPDDFDELPEDEQAEILEILEGAVASVNPADLRLEIARLTRLIGVAQALEAREVETKLGKLRQTLTDQGVFADPKMKLLLFTEHKDTLDYLVGKLRAWGLTVTQIHGGMKIGDRNTPGTRIYAEWEFKEKCQVLVATEAAGEGINLQFCWYMINYDIPWNPVRLEQRMGRIHRYGQEKDCLIVNFVAGNTREGRVLLKLFERLGKIENDLDPKRTGKVFNVLGDVFPANQLERMVREMYARNLTEQVIKDRIVEQVDTARFRKITESTLEGLAKRELNLAALIGKAAEAKERRLIPEVVEEFFLEAAHLTGITPRETRKGAQIYRVGRVPRAVQEWGERLEPVFGRLGQEYNRVVFAKNRLAEDATLEWVTPGHPLFEAVRETVAERVQDDLRRGAVFFDLQRAHPARVDVFSAAVRDGRGHELHRRLFLVETEGEQMCVREATLFGDLQLAQQSAEAGTGVPTAEGWPDKAGVEAFLINGALSTFLKEVIHQRERELATIAAHVEISLNAIIDRVQVQFAALHEQVMAGASEPGLEGRYRIMEERLEELNMRLERRRAELEQERHCTLADIQHVGRAWVLPHPERDTPGFAPMVRDAEIERIAVEAAMAHERERGWVVESVEAENRGYDLISRRAAEVRYIEVKGRAHVGEVALSPNEFQKAGILGEDYWLYVVYNCATQPKVHPIHDPARLGGIVTVAYYVLGPEVVLGAAGR